MSVMVETSVRSLHTLVQRIGAMQGTRGTCAVATARVRPRGDTGQEPLELTQDPAVVFGQVRVGQAFHDTEPGDGRDLVLEVAWGLRGASRDPSLSFVSAVHVRSPVLMIVDDGHDGPKEPGVHRAYS